MSVPKRTVPKEGFSSFRLEAGRVSHFAPQAYRPAAACRVFIQRSRSKRVAGREPSCIDAATRVLHSVADRPLVNIQSDAIHILHGGASFGVSESARSLSFSFCTSSAPPSTYTFKLVKGSLAVELGENRAEEIKNSAISLEILCVTGQSGLHLDARMSACSITSANSVKITIQPRPTIV